MNAKAIQTIVTVVMIGGLLTVTASTAQADSRACGGAPGDVYKDIEYKGNGVDFNYPAKLHGKTVRLRNGGAFNHSFAAMKSPLSISDGEILSIDRATRWGTPFRQSKDRAWYDTSQIFEWEYCQSEGFWLTPAMNNWRTPMRVCLRHNGALQCANLWYEDRG
jgi:hypothetical protein